MYAEGGAPRRIGGEPCRDGGPTRRGRGREPGFCAKKVQKQGATSHWRGAMSHWRGAMSCWGSNATWLEPQARFLRRKGAKSVSHVALGEGDVALGLQRDVAGAASLYFVQKRGQKRAPRRIGGKRSRVGSPTRRGCGSEPGFRAEKRSKVGATSHWRRAKSCWESNATWRRATRPISHAKR